MVDRVQEDDCFRREEIYFRRWSREYHRSLQDTTVRGIICLVFSCERIEVVYNRADSVLDGE